MRQYIGARYVPKFYENGSGTSEWTENTQYEPLTIVTRNGNSYTSKKLVPASVGAPETNSSYWVSTGIYNAQVEQIRQSVSDLADEMTEADAALQTQINSSKERISLLDSKRYIFIGDSYGSREINWIDPLISKFPNNDCYKVARGSAGFAVTPAFLTLLTDAYSSIPNHDTITDIVVCGGANDLDPNLTLSNLNTAINNFITYCRTEYPNAKVHIGYIGALKRSYNQSGFEHEGITYHAYTWSAAYYGADYLAGVEYANRDWSALVDQTHPDQNASNAIAAAVYQALMTGTAEAIANSPYVINTTFTDILDVPHNIGAYMFGNVTTLVIPVTTLRNIASKNLTSFDLNAGITIGTLSETGIVHPSKDLYIPVTCSMDSADASQSGVYPLQLILTASGEVKLYAINVGNPTYTINNIYIRMGRYTYPTMY